MEVRRAALGLGGRLAQGTERRGDLRLPDRDGPTPGAGPRHCEHDHGRIAVRDWREPDGGPLLTGTRPGSHNRSRRADGPVSYGRSDVLVAPIDGRDLRQPTVPVVPVWLRPWVHPPTLAPKSTIVLRSKHPVEPVDHAVYRRHLQLGAPRLGSVWGFAEVVVRYAPYAHGG